MPFEPFDCGALHVTTKDFILQHYTDFSSPGSMTGVIKHTQINDKIILKAAKGTATRYTKFHFCCFAEDVQIFENITNRIEFENCIFKKNVIINNCAAEDQSIQFHDCVLDGELDIKNTSLAELKAVIQVDKISIENTSCKQMKIASAITPENVLLLIKTLHFKVSDFDGTAQIEAAKIGDFCIEGVIKRDSDVVLMRSSFNSISISNLTNTGRLKLFDLHPYIHGRLPSFQIFNSNLGKSEFSNINLVGVSLVKIFNTTLIECIFVNFTWPQKISMHSEPIRPAGDDVLIKKWKVKYESEAYAYMNLRDTYRQIKFAYSKQGDFINEHTFHALEMTTYMRCLRKMRKARNRIFFIRWFYFRSTSLILWFSKMTSNYGQSILAPLLTLAIFGSIAFWGMIKCNFIQGFSPTNFFFNHKSIELTMAEFLWFINPLRRLDVGEVNGGLIIDIAMRIITSYCLYNFIRASRRFVK